LTHQKNVILPVVKAQTPFLSPLLASSQVAPIASAALPSPHTMGHMSSMGFTPDNRGQGRQQASWEGTVVDRQHQQIDATHNPSNIQARAARASQPQSQWQGVLRKSGAPVCSLICLREGMAAEPIGWPSLLDVTLRADLRHAEAHFIATPPPNREVRWLFPVPGEGDPQRLPDFICYLSDKSRAGVIKFGDGSRTLYILPPSKTVCGSMGLTWPPPLPGPTILGALVPSMTGASSLASGGR